MLITLLKFALIMIVFFQKHKRGYYVFTPV